MDHWGDTVKAKTDEFGPLAIGVDPIWADIPDCFKTGVDDAESGLRAYVQFLLKQAKGKIGFVKFQAAFFEAFGLAGLRVLADGCAFARQNGIAIIMDAKRGDIGSTSKAYAEAYLAPASETHGGEFEADCLTVNPYLGPDGVAPFVDCAKAHGKGLFILVKTSNPGSAWLQDRIVDEMTVAEIVADMVDDVGAGWLGQSGLSSVGAVIGATHPEVLDQLRKRMPDAIMLCPGLGPQGGQVENILRLRRPDGTGILAPVSRGISKPKTTSISLDGYRQHVADQIGFYKNALTG